MLNWFRQLFRPTPPPPPPHPLQVAARSTEAGQRREAAEQLAELPEPWAGELLFLLVGDAQATVRQAARASLNRRREQLLPELRQGLHDYRDEVAIACSELLGDPSATPETVEALLTVLKFSRRPVQIAARKALGRCGATALPMLRESLVDAPPWVRDQITMALAEAEQVPVPPAPLPEAEEQREQSL